MKILVAGMNNVQLCYAHMCSSVISCSETLLNFDMNWIGLRQLMVALFLKNWDFWLIFDKVIFLGFNGVEKSFVFFV